MPWHSLKMVGANHHCIVFVTWVYMNDPASANKSIISLHEQVGFIVPKCAFQISWYARLFDIQTLLFDIDRTNMLKLNSVVVGSFWHGLDDAVVSEPWIPSPPQALSSSLYNDQTLTLCGSQLAQREVSVTARVQQPAHVRDSVLVHRVFCTPACLLYTSMCMWIYICTHIMCALLSLSWCCVGAWLHLCSPKSVGFKFGC